jgi:hypothetical protein
VPTETVTSNFVLESSKAETGVHGHVVSSFVIEGGPFLSSSPHATVVSFLVLVSTPNNPSAFETVHGDLTLSATPLLVVGAVETVRSYMTLESVGNNLIPSQTANTYAIDDSAADGVFPVPGFGSYKIFSKWVSQQIKEVRVFRYGDTHENAAIDEDLTRHAWELEVNVDRNDMQLIWNFIKNHYGLGVPFYFYDLQMNGWEYDPSGVSENGRYLVRFDGTEFSQSYQQGERFVIPFNLIEVI